MGRPSCLILCRGSLVNENGLDTIIEGLPMAISVYFLRHLVCVYRFGGLIDRCSALGVVYKCHLCSHSDACRVSGNCVCRHLTSASFRSTL